MFLLIQPIMLKFDSSILIPTTTTPLIDPCFFGNLEPQGVSGVLLWIDIFVVTFLAVGYLFLGPDKAGKKKPEKAKILASTRRNREYEDSAGSKMM